MERYKARFTPGNAQRLRLLRNCIAQLIKVRAWVSE
jgi:hypothetical protein